MGYELLTTSQSIELSVLARQLNFHDASEMMQTK